MRFIFFLTKAWTYERPRLRAASTIAFRCSRAVAAGDGNVEDVSYFARGANWKSSTKVPSGFWACRAHLSTETDPSGHFRSKRCNARQRRLQATDAFVEPLPVLRPYAQKPGKAREESHGRVR